jgi:Ni,Fe-hydrogenase I cytochrome b subunit
MNRGYNYWQPMEAPVYYHDSGLKHLPIILLSAIAISTAANGISLIIGAFFLFGLLISVMLSGLKLYFLLRYEPRYEQRVPNRRDKVLGYVVLVILLVILAAFGLYGQSGVGSLPTSNAAEAATSSITLMVFFKATLAKSTSAITCWFVAIIVEAIILIIVMRDHREYEYLAE